MKNYEEMAETVFRRIDEYKEKQRKRRKIIYSAASLTCACLVAVVGFTVWKSGRLAHLGGSRGTEGINSSPTDPITLQVPTEDIPEPTSSPTEEPSTDTAPLPSEPPYPIGNGGTITLCTIHAHNTHAFTHSLIEYVGEEAFNQWVSGASMQPIDEGCRNPEYTIYGFIKHFNVPKRVFEEIYYTKCYNTYYYDVDLFYSDDESGVQEFFLDKDTAEDVIYKRVALDELKHGVYSKNYNLFVQKFGDISYEEVTLADMVRELNVPRELLEDYATKTTTGRSYNYNFDLLYLNPGESVKLKTGETVTYDDFNAMLSEAANDPYPVRASDAIICGVEDYRTQ